MLTIWGNVSTMLVDCRPLGNVSTGQIWKDEVIFAGSWSTNHASQENDVWLKRSAIIRSISRRFFEYWHFKFSILKSLKCRQTSETTKVNLHKFVKIFKEKEFALGNLPSYKIMAISSRNLQNVEVQIDTQDNQRWSRIHLSRNVWLKLRQIMSRPPK